MKERIETIPVNEAFDAGDECPFCHLERMTEQRTIRYVLGPGASYMEPDVRAATDSAGFCREHYKKMYDFGNSLGNALIMQTYYAGLIEEFDREAEQFVMPPTKPLIGRRKDTGDHTLLQWAKLRTSSCYICDRVNSSMNRYIATFFMLLKEKEFRTKAENSKGMCMRHFVQVLEQANDQLPNTQREWFYQTIIALMRDNLSRVKEDIDWFVGMFDYRNAGRDWKTATDAVPRGMHKLQGGYPGDKPYKAE